VGGERGTADRWLVAAWCGVRRGTDEDDPGQAGQRDDGYGEGSRELSSQAQGDGRIPVVSRRSRAHTPGRGKMPHIERARGRFTLPD
jgi:hypothetical protein